MALAKLARDHRHVGASGLLSNLRKLFATILCAGESDPIKKDAVSDPVSTGGRGSSPKRCTRTFSAPLDIPAPTPAGGYPRAAGSRNRVFTEPNLS